MGADVVSRFDRVGRNLWFYHVAHTRDYSTPDIRSPRQTARLRSIPIVSLYPSRVYGFWGENGVVLFFAGPPGRAAGNCCPTPLGLDERAASDLTDGSMSCRDVVVLGACTCDDPWVVVGAVNQSDATRYVSGRTELLG